ncbi:hypothetical protein Q4485_09580 [Granulosicoccaceae sp. 1_MG-2023]|nr:hypothetical protein [Granulosicoccaceae sp. 1_MG-2023]
MNNCFPALTAALLCSTLAACSFSTPPRPQYSGADTVGTVQPSMLIGTWDYRILNPREDEPANPDVVMSFNDDGSVVSVSDIPAQDGVPMSAMTLKVTGTWRIDGEYVITTTEDVEETSGNKLAGLVSSLGKRMTTGLEGKADVYEASGKHLILVSTDEDEPLAAELTRR